MYITAAEYLMSYSYRTGFVYSYVDHNINSQSHKAYCSDCSCHLVPGSKLNDDYLVIVSRVISQEDYKIDLWFPPHERVIFNEHMTSVGA